MTENLLNWLLGVVETHPEGIDAKTVGVIKTRLERAVGEIFKKQMEEAEWKRATAVPQTTTTISGAKAYYGANAATSRTSARAALAGDMNAKMDEAIFEVLTGK